MKKIFLLVALNGVLVYGSQPIPVQHPFNPATPANIQLINTLTNDNDLALMPMMFFPFMMELSKLNSKVNYLEKNSGSSPQHSCSSTPQTSTSIVSSTTSTIPTLSPTNETQAISSIEKFLSNVVFKNLTTTNVGIGASCAGALLAWLKVRLLANNISRNNRWASWRLDIPLQVLMELEDDEIIVQLWPSIKDYYGLNGMPPDVLEILRLFLDDISKEKACLADLFWWHNLIKTVRLSAIFGDEEQEKKAQQYQKRLELLEKCVHMWANECLCRDGIAQ